MSLPPLPIPQYVELPHELLSLRAQIDPVNTLNTIHIIHSYIDLLFAHVKDISDGATVETLLSAASQEKFSSSLPWKNIPTYINFSDWTINNEIEMATFLLSLLYIHQTHLLPITSNVQINNHLKQAQSILMCLKKSPMNNLLETQIQLTVISKNIIDVHTSMMEQCGILKVPDKVGTFVKITIGILNDFTTLKNTWPWDGWHIWENSMEVLLCFYLSCQSWDKDEVGMAVSYSNCALLLLLEDNFDKLKIKSSKEGKLSNFKSKFQKGTINDKKLQRGKIKSKFMLPGVQNLLEMVLDLLNIMHVKFTKSNDTINFQKVYSKDQILKDFLLSSSLPSGLKVPNNTKPYLPPCLAGSKNNYNDAYY
ncbi:hypothetical protein DAMA08_007870 [Martiniozyma asiatica (nom. inval.)]|nr:hypothetical protein DAMA08_007870 [Martiniozyma asiatica]